MTVSIIQPGLNIPVHVRGVDITVEDGEMGELLLGRPFLKLLGFNLRSRMERVKGIFHN